LEASTPRTSSWKFLKRHQQVATQTQQNQIGIHFAGKPINDQFFVSNQNPAHCVGTASFTSAR
jgi:hypothetical protein